MGIIKEHFFNGKHVGTTHDLGTLKNHFDADGKYIGTSYDQTEVEREFLESDDEEQGGSVGIKILIAIVAAVIIFFITMSLTDNDAKALFYAFYAFVVILAIFVAIFMLKYFYIPMFMGIIDGIIWIWDKILDAFYWLKDKLFDK